jgi:hypothetical protein
MIRNCCSWPLCSSQCVLWPAIILSLRIMATPSIERDGRHAVLPLEASNPMALVRKPCCGSACFTDGGPDRTWACLPACLPACLHRSLSAPRGSSLPPLPAVTLYSSPTETEQFIAVPPEVLAAAPGIFTLYLRSTSRRQPLYTLR